MVRATRLLSILLLLQARGQLTAQQLADELLVSVRTVYRDVDALQRAGVPIFGDAGPFGGYQLVAGYTTRLTGLSADDAEAVSLAGIPGPAAELGLGAAVASAQLKLQAALPPELRHRARRILDRFHLDTNPWYTDTERPSELTTIADAVWNERRIEVSYSSWIQPSDERRILDPHGLVLKAGNWYLVARHNDQLRTYRIDQISEVTVLDQRFARIDDLDLAEYWNGYLAEFKSRLYPQSAAIRLSHDALSRLGALASAAVIAAVKERESAGGKAEFESDGFVTAEVPIESLEHARSEFLKFGSTIEVLGPPELRDLMGAAVRELTAIYP